MTSEDPILITTKRIIILSVMLVVGLLSYKKGLEKRDELNNRSEVFIHHLSETRRCFWIADLKENTIVPAYISPEGKQCTGPSSRSSASET